MAALGTAEVEMKTATTIASRWLRSLLGGSVPAIGTFLPLRAKPTGMILEGGGHARREYRVTYDRSEFLVTATRWRIISSVHAPLDFVSPEGVAAGKTAVELGTLATGPVVPMGRAFWIMNLPSGWQAGFRDDPGAPGSTVSGLGQWY